MTEFFEVMSRDGPARIGELRLSPPATTPALADDLVEDAGSRWPAERDVPAGREDRVTVLPHRALPAGVDDRVAAAYPPDPPDVAYASAVVVSPATAGDHGADAYVLSTAQGITGHASAFADAVTAVRDAVPPDTALYLPGVATPRNVATLVHAGVDLVDTDRAVIRGTQGRYLTRENEYRLGDLDELPCACATCRDTPVDAFTREDCVDHNVAALDAALATVRRRIRDGRLRDYVEGQARYAGWCTAAFRELDDRWWYVEPRTPVARRADITATSDDTLRRVEIRRFADRVTTRYTNRFDAPLVLVPCSARKPYSESQSHRQFRDAIAWRGHVVSMTSPIGVVPSELELTYPAQHYDTAVTGRWSETELDFVARVLRRYLERNPYPRVIAHVPPEGYRDIVERATADRDVPVEFTVADHPTTDDSLESLRGALADATAYSKSARLRNTVRGIADYQFGDGAGDDLVRDDDAVSGRYPSLRVHDADGEQVATLVPSFGLLALTLHGARRWADAPTPTLTVDIDDFVPHGSVLAPGVETADDAVRVGDEVVVCGPSAFGVGRAAMSGPEMARSTRGVAVDVRHVEER